MAENDPLRAALAEIRERARRATPGPWAWRGNVDNGDPYLTSRGYREVAKPDGTTVRHHAGDVLGHIPVELTREDALRRGVGDYDSLPEPKVSREPEETYGKRYDAALAAAQEAEIEDYLTGEYGNPRTEQRMAFCTDWLYTDARKLVVFEVAPGVTDRADPRVYRADVTGIRHPDAEFIAGARTDVPRLLAAVEAVLKLADEWDASAAELDRDVTRDLRSPYPGDHALAATDEALARELRQCAADLRADLLAALTGEGKADA